MQQTILRLIQLISEETAIFQRFLELLNQQQEALVANDITRLEQITALQEALNARTQEIEEKRKKLVRTISSDLKLGQDDLNLSALTKLVSEPESNQLHQLQETLLELHRQIGNTKSRNEFLIKKSLDFLNNTISHLAGTTNGKTTYLKNEVKRERDPQSIALDRRA